MVLVGRLLSLLTVLLVAVLVVAENATSDTGELHELFYQEVDVSGICFRLTNATHQIGCSASSSQTRGVLYYVEKLEDIEQLPHNASHAPYVVLLEAKLFTGSNLTVRKLKSMESLVNGLLVRYNADDTLDKEGFLSHFSPVGKCPNENTGQSSACHEPWNEYGTDLLFTDFEDFPIFLLNSDSFDDLVECYHNHNQGAKGGYGDFPLCSVELLADMAAAVDTPTCLRREVLPIPYLNGEQYCDPLGDFTAWGSLYNLTQNKEVILLATKLDSISFFPYFGSFGASSEVAAIATLLAVVQQLGAVKRKFNDGLSLSKQVLYTFFQGESWDNIGSSRMAYDMSHKNNFPDKDRYALPNVTLGNISHFIEFGQLGLLSSRTVYVHGNKSSDFTQHLMDVGPGVNVTVKNSSRQDLPSASLKRFLKEGIANENGNFAGSVLTSYNDRFQNRFFGSRFDDANNFNRSMDEVVADLAAVATAVAKAVFNVSGPRCDSGSCTDVEASIDADEGLISDVLTCFLSNSSCDLFRSVLVGGLANGLGAMEGPLSRYVGTTGSTKLETTIIYQLLAYFTAFNATELSTPVNCSDCLKRISDAQKAAEESKSKMTTNITWVRHNSDASQDLCLCVESFTYVHAAVSPVFDYDLGHDNRNYSTWAESVWSSPYLRVYMVTYSLQEVGFLAIGLFLTAITSAVSFQCTRKGNVIFQTTESYSVVDTN